MDNQKLSKEEFEINFAKKYGFTLTELRDIGLFAIPCNCGSPNCQGWLMANNFLENNNKAATGLSTNDNLSPTGTVEQ